MGLTFITGVANAGKTGVVYDIFRGSLRRGGSPVLLLPSRPDVMRAADELSVEFPVGLRVHTFDEYISDQWASRGDGRRLLDGQLADLLMAGLARQRGVSRGIARLATRCADRLADQTGADWRDAVPAAPGPAEALIDLLVAYARELTARDLLYPAEALRHLTATGWDDAGPLLFHRFTDFTHTQTRLVEAAAPTREVLISLTWAPGRAPSASLDSFVANWPGAQIVEIRGEKGGTDPALVALAGRIWESGQSALPLSPAITFGLAEGRDTQARLVAAIVRGEIERGVSPGAIAVAYRSLAPHLPHLISEFRRAGLKADFDAPISLGGTAFGRALGAALDFAICGERAALLTLMNSPFSGSSRDAMRATEARWRQRGITSPHALVRDVAAVSPTMGRILVDLQAVADRELTPDDLSAIARAAADIYALAQAGDTHDEREGRAYGQTVRTLQAAALAGPAGIVLADVAAALAEVEVPPGETERPGRVQVGTVGRLRSRRFDVVVLAGLNAGEFPVAPAETLLPGTAVGRALAAFGGEGDDEGGADLERALFYHAVTRARRKLVLLGCATDEDGEGERLSPYLEEVADAYRDGSGSFPEHVYVAAGQSAVEQGIGEREALRKDVLQPGRTARTEWARARARGLKPELRSPLLLSELAASDVFSATEIESYLGCPYAWFIGRQLRPESLDATEDARTQGDFAHQLLSAAYSRFAEEGIVRVEPQNVDRCAAIVDLVFAQVEAGFGDSTSFVGRADRLRTVQWAKRTIRTDAMLFPAFRPEYREWRFGLGDTEPVDLGDFKLRGAVDRIDVDERGRAIVTDYKRSSATPAAKMIGDGKVQLPLYMAAVSARLGLKPVAGVYRILKGDGHRGIALKGAVEWPFTGTDALESGAFEDALDACLSMAKDAVAGIRAAEIPRAPRTEQRCLTCSAAALCGGARP